MTSFDFDGCHKGGLSMAWQDSDEEIKIDRQNEAEFQEEDYSPLGPKKRSRGRIFQFPAWPFRWIAIGVIILVAIIVIFFSGSDTADPSRKLVALEKRIVQLEKQMAGLDPSTMEKAVTGLDTQKVEQYFGRLDRFEASTNKRMDYLTKRVDNLSKKTPAQVRPTTKKPTKAPKETETKPQYHLVSKGETLYSISRTYGLTLNDLRRLNNLKEKAAIYPGQKLKIK
jgi:hypothetical protein